MTITTHARGQFLRGMRTRGRVKISKKMPRKQKLLKLKLPKLKTKSLLKLPKMSGGILRVPAVGKIKTPKIKAPKIKTPRRKIRGVLV